MARRLVQCGDEVEWFSASFPEAPPEETLQGVRIVRAGSQSTVHWHAFRHYRSRISEAFDVVVDQVNTIPFFTPLWSTIPVVMFIHQLAREVWWYESPFPLNVIGYFTEPLYLRCYRRRPVLTVSASTRGDLRRLGFHGPIAIIPEGLVPTPSVADFVKTPDPTFLYVGRLAPSKRIEHLLKAMSLFRRSSRVGRLWLVGTGSSSYTRRLMEMASRFGIADHVTFYGHVSNQERNALMTQAHALLMTSVREGWGLAVTEANACGTPAIVYDVPGLRDSVRNGRTGLVVAPYPSQLASAMERITGDQRLYSDLAVEARRWSDQFTFDATASAFRAEIEKGMHHDATAQMPTKT